MTSKRYGFLAALTAAIAACTSSTNSGTPYLVLSPLVDSLFVGDSAPALQATYYDASGNVQPTGTIAWSSNATNVAQVDAATGKIHAVGRGTAVIAATTNGTSGEALVAVSDSLDLTILLDTIYQMPGDTFTVPYALRHKAPGTAAVWFTTSTNAVFKIDSLTGRDTAMNPGLRLPFVAHAALGTDTTVDTGYVEVILPTDTTGGKGFFTVYGSVIRHVAAGQRALNYPTASLAPTFRLRSFVSVGGSTVEAVILTLLNPVTAPGSFVIDSISPAEAFTTDPAKSPVCYPPRPWGTWSALFTNFRIDAVSRPAGHLGITQVKPVIGGQAISGSYSFTGQRTDFYTDPLGAVAVRGTFVAPLITTTSTCK